MKALKLSLFILIMLLAESRCIYASSDNKFDEASQGAEAAFNQMIDLWYDQKFDELYDRFAYKEKGRISKEKFITRMTKEKQRLACCWQKAQDIKVKLSASGKAIISAKLGFEKESDVAYVNAEMPFYFKDERWTCKAKDILSIAPDLPKYKSKKKKGSKYKAAD